MSGPKAELLQQNEVVKSRLKSWRDNLLGLMRERSLTQNGLAELINNRFYGESDQFTQKNVSAWDSMLVFRTGRAMCGLFPNSKSCFKSPRCSRSISAIS